MIREYCHKIICKSYIKSYMPAIAALKGQWPFLRFLAILDSKSATIVGLSSF